MKKLIIIIFCLSCISCSTYIPLFKGDCVDRSVAIRQKLKSEGYKAEIIIGVDRKTRSEAHAWIRYRKNDTDSWIIYENIYCLQTEDE